MFTLYCNKINYRNFLSYTVRPYRCHHEFMSSNKKCFIVVPYFFWNFKKSTFFFRLNILYRLLLTCLLTLLCYLTRGKLQRSGQRICWYKKLASIKQKKVKYVNVNLHPDCIERKTRSVCERKRERQKERDGERGGQAKQREANF